MPADVAGKASVGEEDVGLEGFELAIEEDVELAVVRRAPCGDAQASGVEQRVGNAALEEAEFTAVLIRWRLDFDVEPGTLKIGERIGLRSSLGCRGSQGADFKSTSAAISRAVCAVRAAPLAGSCGICGRAIRIRGFI